MGTLTMFLPVLSANALISKKIRNRANITAILVVSPMIGFVLGLWSMPITHRLVFVVVFGWTAITSVELLIRQNKALKLAPKEDQT